MKSKSKQPLSQPQRQRLLECCGEIHEDDCIDPRTFFKPNRDQKANHKGQQLCRQAFETLALVLADCDDELMQSLSIAQVNLSSDGARLIATVAVHGQASTQQNWNDLGPDLILSRLAEQIARLRSELAQSISRKRVPNLSFELEYSNLQQEQNHEDSN